jgi:CMP-N,N'-diacetyllegionaminic acid synthase
MHIEDTPSPDRLERVLAIIPARGGSKGIPRKNLRRLAGRPLLVHTIDHALATSSVSRVVVSTDDDEIAAVAAGAGAEVVRRPAVLAADEAISESVLLHVLDHLRDAESYEPGLVVFLQATAPIRRKNDIDDAITRLREAGADSLLSVVPSRSFIWRVVHGEPTPLNYDHRVRPRRQDMPLEFVENGSIYVFKPWVLRQTTNRLGGRVAMYVMSRWSAVDIDDPGDLALCEWIMANPDLLDGNDNAC